MNEENTYKSKMENGFEIHIKKMKNGKYEVKIGTIFVIDKSAVFSEENGVLDIKYIGVSNPIMREYIKSAINKFLGKGQEEMSDDKQAEEIESNESSEKKSVGKAKKYVQQEITGMKKRGGWRGGGRPKSTGQTTIAVRIDKRLENLVNALKQELKNGTLNEDKIKNLIENVQENTQKLPRNYDESINFDAEMEKLDASYEERSECYAEQKDGSRCKKQHKTIIETEKSDILLCATHEKAYKNGTLKIHKTALN